MTIENDIERVSREFSKVLLHNLGHKVLCAVVDANTKERDPSVCHSHDHIDANVAMDRAMKRAGISEGSSREQLVWDRAWKLAKKMKFYIPQKSHEIKENPMPDLTDIFTEKQWGEIYYALETKAKMIKDGQYGPEEKRGENKRWIEDLNEIMDRISGEVDV